MLWYSSLSELGKNCTPIFSPPPYACLFYGQYREGLSIFLLCFMGSQYDVICTMNSQPSGVTELTTQSV